MDEGKVTAAARTSARPVIVAAAVHPRSTPRTIRVPPSVESSCECYISAPMKEFVCEVTARSYELDAFGHVNHAVYLNYLELARFDSLQAGGLSPAALARGGWAIHVVRVEADYLKPVFQGQVLRIRTRVEAFRKTSMIIAQTIHRVDDGPDSGPALRARVTTVWIGEGGRPVRIPPAARSALGG